MADMAGFRERAVSHLNTAAALAEIEKQEGPAEEHDRRLTRRSPNPFLYNLVMKRPIVVQVLAQHPSGAYS